MLDVQICAVKMMIHQWRNGAFPRLHGLEQHLSPLKVPFEGTTPPNRAQAPFGGRRGFPASTIVSQASMQGEEDGRKRNTKKR